MSDRDAGYLACLAAAATLLIVYLGGGPERVVGRAVTAAHTTPGAVQRYFAPLSAVARRSVLTDRVPRADIGPGDSVPAVEPSIDR